jgi:hypothetical protein
MALRRNTKKTQPIDKTLKIDVATVAQQRARSMAIESGAFIAGKIVVTPISGKGVDVTAMGTQVGLVAPSKKVKATWIRMS